MPTLSVSIDANETHQRTATIRTNTRIVRVTEHVDSPATCSLVPSNPRARCIPITLPTPLDFDHTVAYLSQRMPNAHLIAS